MLHDPSRPLRFFPRILARSEPGARPHFHTLCGDESLRSGAREPPANTFLSRGHSSERRKPADRPGEQELIPDTSPAGPSGQRMAFLQRPSAPRPGSNSGLGSGPCCRQPEPGSLWPGEARGRSRSAAADASEGDVCSPPPAPPTRIAACPHHSVCAVPVPVLAGSLNPAFPGRSSSQRHKVPTRPAVGRTERSQLTLSAEVSERLQRARRRSEGGGCSSGKGRSRLQGPAHTRGPQSASRSVPRSDEQHSGTGGRRVVGRGGFDERPFEGRGLDVSDSSNE